MLRIPFTVQDLLSTRFAAEPAPLMELGLAVATLQGRDPLFEQWRLSAASALPVAARPLFDLVPASAAGPVFLDPITEGVEDGVDAVRSAPGAFVSSELRRVCAGSVTPWVKALDERDPAAWTVLETALLAAYDTLLHRSWPRVRAAYRAEIALRGRAWTNAGVRGVLSCIHPGTRWDGDVLQIPVESRLVIDLAGRGVTLMPSVFWRGRPMFGRHPDGSLLVVYPAATPLPLLVTHPTGESLASLLGATRAAVLELTATTLTTTELAHAAEISAASASDHARVLRSCGLITTTRAGRTVLHSLTPLGDELLTSTSPGDAPSPRGEHRPNSAGCRHG